MQGGRGGFVSKIANEEFDQITREEKEVFLSLFESELIRAKEYSNIDDSQIETTVNVLNFGISQTEKINTIISKLEKNMFQMIKNDIYNINNISKDSGCAIPSLGWIKGYVNFYYNNMSEDITPPESCTHNNVLYECHNKYCKKRQLFDDGCENCRHKTFCMNCKVHDSCTEIYKTSRVFDIIGKLEEDFFTAIYLGMMIQARNAFIKLVLEYKEVQETRLSDEAEAELAVLPDHITLDEDIYYDSIDISGDKINYLEAAKQNLARAIYEGALDDKHTFDTFIDGATLNALRKEGIVKEE